jgi:hypothetical protein
VRKSTYASQDATRAHSPLGARVQVQNMYEYSERVLAGQPSGFSTSVHTVADMCFPCMCAVILRIDLPEIGAGGRVPVERAKIRCSSI